MFTRTIALRLIDLPPFIVILNHPATALNHTTTASRKQNEFRFSAKFTKSGNPLPLKQRYTNEIPDFAKFTKYGNT